MNKITRTTNPLPFEVLEPHKFEDVVRGLLYDFKDWQTIEPTGKGGSDDGYDARGWERVKVIENEDENDTTDGKHPMNGNLWMIQCKREKTITPKKLEKYLEAINSTNPPYGYILAAACEFSKKAQDVFRETLIKKNVTEFYLWGKGYLEDMLYLPKNDRILFTTFGISLNTKRRSITTETKFAINNKNKVFRIWGDANSNDLKYEPALVRDFNDEKYPYEGEYPDFVDRPRWKEYMPLEHNPMGLWLHTKEYYAYLDLQKKEFDFCNVVDLINRKSDLRKYYNDGKREELREKVSEFWERLPIMNQAKFNIDGLLYFKDMLLIDDQGDSVHNFPHIYAEFNKEGHPPFGNFRNTFDTNKGSVQFMPDFKRVIIFPKTFMNHLPKNDKKTIIDIPYDSLGLFKERMGVCGRIYDLDNKYKLLKKGSIVVVSDDSNLTGSTTNNDRYLEVTQIQDTTIGEFTKENPEFIYKEQIKQQAKRDILDIDEMRVSEVRLIRGKI